MGPTHLTAGCATYLLGSIAAQQQWHLHQSPTQLAAGTLMAGFGALLPDLDRSGAVLRDKGGAMVGRSFGRLSLFLAECVEKVSLGVYTVVRWRDPDREDGHRTLLHALIFWAAAGYGLAAAIGAAGRVGVAVASAVAASVVFAPGAHVLRWLARLVNGAAVGAASWLLLPDAGSPMLAWAIAIGAFSHLATDTCTTDGCPLLWPLPIGRRLWHRIRLPLLSCKAGGECEERFWKPVLTWAAIGALLVSLDPAAAHHLIASIHR